ncbi:hypothetical protein Tco_0530905 [Tanacetum coccineum]
MSTMEEMEKEETAKRFEHMMLVRHRMRLVGNRLKLNMMLVHNRMRLIRNYMRLVDKQSISNKEPEVRVICVDNSCLLTEFRGGGVHKAQVKAIALYSEEKIKAHPRNEVGLLAMGVAVDVVNFGMQFLPKTKKKLLEEFVGAVDNHGNSHYLYAPSGSRTSLRQQILRSPLAPGGLPMQEEKKKEEEVEKNNKAIDKMKKKKLNLTKNLSCALHRGVFQCVR